MGNTINQSYEEMSNLEDDQITFGKEKCSKELDWKGDKSRKLEYGKPPTKMIRYVSLS